ncbi:endoribonuclease Dicer homolog 3a-like [Impatiens glandulifera]|uniref:endoribonuclease Dicer homolog 3a-like n=1 Tax=Impatiens glandulifera TaxID=253017 RepID=UPI001FB13B90|nr:endoribonuclease Dicer homolog 3a-like [Impatiens glandulifera]
MRRNTITVLGTGSGKTLIAVMIIKEMGLSLSSFPGRKKLIMFLAPTVHLVHQQFEVVKTHTSLRVDEYYGLKGVDDWNSQHWEKEVNANDVFVMTPQILLDALRKSFLSFDMIHLMVLDECHLATGSHPYAKIMKEFYHECDNKPKIFGMTASPVIRKGVTSDEDCQEQISELESLLDSQVFTIETSKELDEVLYPAKESSIFYDSSVSFNLQLKEKMKCIWEKYDSILLRLQESEPKQYKAVQKLLINDHAKILHCLQDLGLRCAYETIKMCAEKESNASEGCEYDGGSSVQRKLFLEEVLFAIVESLPNGHESLLETGSDFSKAVAIGYISPKLYELIKIFQSFGGVMEELCLIFVERIITAKVIERVMKTITCLSHLTVSYITGSSSTDGLTPKLQKDMLESFRSGKVNLLFTTDVLEEGIDVPNCSSVIRFDLPKTVRSHIQSRGRARQCDSQFIVMLERGNKTHTDEMFDIIKSECSMINTAITRDLAVACNSRVSTMEKTEVYHVDATGASVTSDSSVQLVHRYCQNLPVYRGFMPKATFQISQCENLYQCTLTLPPNAAFQTLTGPTSKSSRLSKQLVCFDACKKLHQLGALTDRLLPLGKDSLGKKSSPNIKNGSTGAGTTKRKELHGTTQVKALSGTWGEKVDGTTFYAYEIQFNCNLTWEKYGSFILLLESQLADDVGNVEVELFLVSKFIKSTVSSSGQIHLTPDQVDKAMRFQELFFNGLYGKLFIPCSRSEGRKREFLLQKQDNKRLWDLSNMYLLLPLESTKTSYDGSPVINWTGIQSCSSVIEFLKKNDALGGDEQYVSENGILSNPSSESADIIKFANNSFDKNSLKGMVVMAIHTGKIYYILTVVDDSSAASPFEESPDGRPSCFSSFSDYFKRKYMIKLAYPDQPLLLLKQSHNAFNLLVDFKKGGMCNKPGESNDVVQKTLSNVHIPPELLVSIDVPREVLRSFYLLPSLMHRLESLMLANQLREEFASPSMDFCISSSLILEAITTLRCNESFSMERLELLGDSVLKYAVSCHLFLKYLNKHEGQLSGERIKLISNSFLHQRGTDNNLQGYIRDSPYDPRRWNAPGQMSIRPYPCLCEVDTPNVPLDENFQTNNINIKLGMICDKGHRWMGSKTISDCFEALIGAYYLGGGLRAAIHIMKRFGIDLDLDFSMVNETIKIASLRSYVPKNNNIEDLESKIGYVFSNKGLLQEAITHSTEKESNFCYERLEFLGDSVLDILITMHLFQKHTDTDPGELTDLRAASVSNENFGYAAVKHNLHVHLQHGSEMLRSHISEFANSITFSDSTPNNKCLNVPKVLGDLVESIAGAILIDSKLNLDEVWRIFEPLLSPIVTPDKLELAPFRELMELCDSLGYFIKENSITRGEVVNAEIRLQLKDILLVGEGSGHTRKLAKGNAALILLKELKERGISHSKSSNTEKESNGCGTFTLLNMKNDVFNKTSREGDTLVSSISPHKKQKTEKKHILEKCINNSESNIPVALINKKKGGPRVSLYELCRKQQWPMPTFETTEHKSRTPIEFGEGAEKKTGFNSYMSKITLIIPEFGAIEMSGHEQADKKSSFDSAALAMLYKLEEQEKIKLSTE